MANDTISILDGSTFLVGDRRGDVDASPDQPHGFFYRDTRFLSRWQLTANGSPLNVLSTDLVSYFAIKFFLVPPTGTVNENPTVSIIRNRAIGDGFHEDVTVLNHDVKPLEFQIRLEADADFADLFEVKDSLTKKGEHYRRIDGDTLVLGYRRDDYVRETRIRASKECMVDERGFTFDLRLEPHSEWNSCVFVQPVTDHAVEIKYRHDEEQAKPNIGMSLDEFIAAAPKLETD
jgi:glycogen debranching enzyme